MTIFERVEAALNTLSPAVPWMYKQYLTASDAALPDTYLVYSLVSSPPEEHADDAETLRSYTVQVATYKVGSLVGAPNIAAVMVSAGFMQGNQRETSNYPDSTHFGLAQEFTYLE
jgi:hypothetical protein